MGFRHASLKYFVIAFFISIAVITLAPSINAQWYDLEVYVGDTISLVNQEDVVVPIFLRNWNDTVAAFQLTLFSDHPGILQFSGIDINGTLIESWEYVNIPYSGNSLSIMAMANTVPPPYTPGIGYPQAGPIPLIKFLVDIGIPPDTMTAENIAIGIRASLHEFNFSDELGNSIGVSYNEPTIDTSYYNCTEWDIDIDSLCMGWEEVSGPPADSTLIETILNPYLDTSLVKIRGGDLNLFNCMLMGDADCTGSRNLLDVTTLINLLYKNGPEPGCLNQADINCDCLINIMDITCMIGWLYMEGSCTPCSCQELDNNCERK